MISDFYRSARKTGAVCHVARGLNVCSSIHVDDLAALHGLALEKGQAGALYFAVSAEVSYGGRARVIATTLGVTIHGVSVEKACEIWDRFVGKIVLQSCSRQRSPRARSEVGWATRGTAKHSRGIRRPSCAAEGKRALPSWVRKPQAA